ncbi:hypothetical protein [Okeania sp. SIO2C9]|nr:hypothetical protein [Okeania sp. SIO2C9]
MKQTAALSLFRSPRWPTIDQQSGQMQGNANQEREHAPREKENL